MLVTATFRHEILPPYGIPISSLKTQLDPFEVEIEGTTVRIIPVIDEMSYTEPVTDIDGKEIGERQVHYHTLHSIEAVIRREVESVEPKFFDRSRFEVPALSALSATMRHIRSATGIVDIDVHVGVVAHEYLDELGNPLPWWSTNSLDLGGVGTLSGPDWGSVVNNVTQGKDTSLSSELLMEARRFYRQRNYTMALLNAAIACEIHLNRLIATALHRQVGFTIERAEKWTKNVPNDKLLALVDGFYDLPTEVVLSDEKIDPIALAQKTFRKRNKVAHGNEKTTVSAEEAEEAIQAAIRLADAVPKANRDRA